MELSDNSNQSPVIAMVAGETSGDQLGSELIVSLQKRYPNARFVGIGGPKMLSHGFESWYPMEKLSVMGFFEVLKHLRELLKLRKELIQRLIALKPDVFIGIDAPDFNFKVEETLKHHRIKAIHYVGPSVWAWREKRLEKIKRQVDGVLVLFPFEEPLYHKYQIPVKFVGHPLANEISMEPDQVAAREALGLPLDPVITGIMPGSRMSEINQMSDVYIQAATLLQKQYPQMQFIVPCVHERAKARIQQSVDDFGQGLKIHLFNQQAGLVIEASDQLVVTSGTATLQAALYKKPLVLAIKLHPITHWIMRRLATTKWVGLPNVLAQKTLVTELIQKEVTADSVAKELERLITDSSLRNRQIEAFKKQHQQLRQNASEKAADAIDQWALNLESI